MTLPDAVTRSPGPDAGASFESIACRACGAPASASRRRCGGCGFSPHELRRWRARNLVAWRSCCASLRWRTWEVVAFAAACVLPALCIYAIAKAGGSSSISVPSLTREINRFLLPALAVLGMVVAMRIDLALRALPPWASVVGGEGTRAWFDRWWPGALLLVVAGHVLKYFDLPRRPFGLEVFRTIKLLFDVAAVGAAASMAVAAARMDRWSMLVGPSTPGAALQPQAATARTVRGVFACWIALAVVLMGDSLWNLGSPQFSWKYTDGINMSAAIDWSAGIVWLWNLFAVQRSLRRLVNG